MGDEPPKRALHTVDGNVERANDMKVLSSYARRTDRRPG